MDRGVYIAASGMLAEQIRQDQIANDLANLVYEQTGRSSAQGVRTGSGAAAARPALRVRPDLGRGPGKRHDQHQLLGTQGAQPPMSTVTVESSRFGTLEIEAGAIIEFPSGLIGLSGRRWAVVSKDPNGPFSWLHSLDDPSLALPVTNPWGFFADYEVELSDADSERVDGDDVAVWVTVRAVPGRQGRPGRCLTGGARLRAPTPEAFQGGIFPCSSSPAVPARRSCSATRSSST
jgi:hypothetical protein